MGIWNSLGDVRNLGDEHSSLYRNNEQLSKEKPKEKLCVCGCVCVLGLGCSSDKRDELLSMEQFQKVKPPRSEEPQGRQYLITAALGEGWHSELGHS